MGGIWGRVAIGVGAAAGFCLLWCAVLALCAWLSGWRRLAAEYPGHRVVGADALRWASARIGIVDYSGALSILVDASGLAIAPAWFFRPFHPPLEIPWSDIEVGAPPAHALCGLRLRIPALPSARVRLFGRAARHCAAFRATEGS
jgi:hypothetical protein